MIPKILWQDRPAPAPGHSTSRYASFWDELLDHAEDMVAHPQHHQATTAWQFEERLAEQLAGYRSEREIFTDPRALDRCKILTGEVDGLPTLRICEDRGIKLIVRLSVVFLPESEKVLVPVAPSVV